MPNPAFAKLRQAATTAFHVGDRAVRTATPMVLRAADDVRDRLRKAGAPTAAPTPTRTGATAEPAVAPPGRTEPETRPTHKAGNEQTGGPTGDVPTPASIAKNVPHQRPVAKPAPAATRKPSDAPGGKLPPRR
ncbi:hypothetical protein [Nocardioides sp. 1609]|uniref:hypothetical protein n=1 Tax=Nocardioides sp. 1609 TaxID=2508327 RepID=UPI0010705BA6|nr:hypothetical protein [Nocardioides sp. 1609]